jgi:hypothetical protein
MAGAHDTLDVQL